jgi:predicted anti-sigma-YlaC factor YlaD
MDWAHRLNEAEISDALLGKPADEHTANCESCAAELAAWTELGGRLRQDLESRADLPAHFWTRQQARIRERLAPRAARLRWAAATICGLVILAFGLIRQGDTPQTEVAQTTPAAMAVRVAQADPDDALLQDVQASLQREVPASLAPAAVLIEEVASASKQVQQVKEN